MTPLEKLASLPDAGTYLREGIALEALLQQVRAMTDLHTAQAVNKANADLFNDVIKQTSRT